MKISKRDIRWFMGCGNRFHEHINQCISTNPDHDFDNDNVHKDNWDLYYSTIQNRYGADFGDLLFSLIEYVHNNDLTLENIEDALNAVDVEVEE